MRTFAIGVSLLLSGALSTAMAAEESEGGLPQLDSSTYGSQLLWLLITFFILYFLCARIFLPRLGGIIEDRRNRIADDLDQAAEFKREAEAAEAGYKKSLADAKARAAQIAAETRDGLDAEIREMEAETDRQLEADITAAEARIAETADKAAAQVREAAKETAKALVTTLIDETPSDEAVDAALKAVEA